ncbi:uncharacterized protein RHIMIDRAFT_251310 [Rhizopus microsporus ATCC 52813]|uniref:Arrestin C-terminal-like domain-containing protein n=2 Tax=Rhizopus microsporus TaxID=58291 RepID=A0A2G4SWY1_RHIZD|nr:uncharacterized protein RHIMIDRAFT_251310 [Rhizopus microsporus ATCC 52813]PHZ13255.1 hypothetical protein RHIMIDRAFT_251310 [Rhizopus microsporus ATCC 52813]
MWPLTKPNNIEIELLESVVYIGPHTRTNPIVRGVVRVSNNRTSHIHILNILFVCDIKTKYCYNNKFSCDKKSITGDRLTLYCSHRKPLVINSDSATQLSFEMPLPSEIPETINCPQIHVNHHVTLDVEYYYDQRKLYQQIRKPVIIARLPDCRMLTGENLLEMIDSRKNESSWCQYRITIKKKAAPLGSRLPIQFEIAPLIPGVKLKEIYVQLMERRTVVPDVDRVERTTQSCFFIYPVKNSSFQLPTNILESPWEATVEYQLPSKMAHSTETYQNFFVNHLLLVSLVFQVPESENSTKHTTKSISFSSSIDLLHKHTANATRLPTYHSLVSADETIHRHTINLDQPPPDYNAVI